MTKHLLCWLALTSPAWAASDHQLKVTASQPLGSLSFRAPGDPWIDIVDLAAPDTGYLSFPESTPVIDIRIGSLGTTQHDMQWLIDLAVLGPDGYGGSSGSVTFGEPSGGIVDAHYQSGAVSFSRQPQVTPEPATASLCAVALIGLAWRSRRRA